MFFFFSFSLQNPFTSLDFCICLLIFSLNLNINFISFHFIPSTTIREPEIFNDCLCVSVSVCLCKWIYAVKLTVKNSVYYMCICCVCILCIKQSQTTITKIRKKNLAQSVASSFWMLPISLTFFSQFRSLFLSDFNNQILLPFPFLCLYLFCVCMR